MSRPILGIMKSVWFGTQNDRETNELPDFLARTRSKRFYRDDVRANETEGKRWEPPVFWVPNHTDFHDWEANRGSF